MSRTLQATFADRALADHAVAALLDHGARFEDVRLEGETPRVQVAVQLRDERLRPEEVEGLLRRHGASAVVPGTTLPVEVEVGTLEPHPSTRPARQDVSLRTGTVEVQRVPVSRLADGVDLEAFRDGIVELVETIEEPVVRKIPRVVEEVVITRRLTERIETVRETLRREDVRVDFREHHQKARATATYEEWEPAYMLGAEAAARPDWRERDWALVEPDVERSWSGGRPWSEVRDAVRYGYERRRQA